MDNCAKFNLIRLIVTMCTALFVFEEPILSLTFLTTALASAIMLNIIDRLEFESLRRRQIDSYASRKRNFSSPECTVLYRQLCAVRQEYRARARWPQLFDDGEIMGPPCHTSTPIPKVEEWSFLDELISRDLARPQPVPMEVD